MMQSAEATVLGQPQRGGPADTMRAAMEWNERARLIGRGDVTDVARKEGFTVGRTVTERVAGQVVGQSVEGVSATTGAESQATQQSTKTIGEELEAAAQSAGDKPVDQSDAAAILVAEQRTMGSDLVVPGGLVASAKTAEAYNEGKLGDKAEIQISDVLTGATMKLPADRVANREDAEWVVNTELRMGDKTVAHPGGVAAVAVETQREYHQSVKNVVKLFSSFGSVSFVVAFSSLVVMGLLV